MYPCLITGLLLMIHARNPGRDRTSLLDSLMVAIGVATVSWVLLISPYIHIADLDLKIKLTAMAYPVMDLLLAVVAIRLAVGAGRKPVAFYLMITAIGALFVTDAIYAWFGLYTESGYQPGSGLLEAGWMAFYVLLGTAALHPSMVNITDKAPEWEDRLTFGRLALLTTAALAPPVVRLVQNWRGEPVDTNVLSAASIILFLLVVVRMAGLIRQQERSALRERALRESGMALVTATNREGIHSAAIDAAQALAGVDAAIRMCDVPDDAEDLEVVAAAGGRADVVGITFPLSILQEWKQERLLDNDAYMVRSYESTLRDPLALPIDDEGSVFVAPLFMREELHGIMVVSTPEEMPRSAADSLQALSSQVALALESAALTEDLLRQQSEARFASLVQNSSDIVTVLELDTTIRYASPSAHRVLGVAPEALEGTKFADLIHPDDMTRALAFLTSLGEAEGHTGLVEFRLRHHDGTYLTVETLRTNLLHDPQRERHRAQHPRHQRAQGVREAAVAPGLPRFGHEPREPRAVQRPRHARDRAPGPRPQAGGGAVHGPRRLQDDQRLARACRGRPGPARGGRTAQGMPARRRHRRPAGWGRVRDPARGRGRRHPGRRRRRPHHAGARSALRPGRQGGLRPGQRSASRSPPRAPRCPTPRSCCATPTSRCTWRRRRARAAIRCSSPRCTTPR